MSFDDFQFYNWYWQKWILIPVNLFAKESITGGNLTNDQMD